MAENETPRDWAKDVRPTPEQLANWLERCTREEREAFAERALDAYERAHRCFIENHQGQIRQLETKLWILKEMDSGPL